MKISTLKSFITKPFTFIANVFKVAEVDGITFYSKSSLSNYLTWKENEKFRKSINGTRYRLWLDGLYTCDANEIYMKLCDFVYKNGGVIEHRNLRIVPCSSRLDITYICTKPFLFDENDININLA